MGKIGIFYGSTTGTTEMVAGKIASDLGVSPSDVHDVAKTAPSEVGDYDVLILGASTWGDGDMQDDMHDFLDGVKSIDMNDKTVALFGCGDDTMSDTFCNAVGKMYEDLKSTGAKFVGDYNTDGYEFDHSDAQVDGHTVGLLVDNMNHEDLTDKRIAAWCEMLKKEI